MEPQTIQAELRTGSGKGVARKLRASSLIPAVAYGGEGETRHLSLDPKELHDLHKGPLGWNQPVTIQVDGGDDIALALLRAVQRHPTSGHLLHADFQCVEAGSEIKVNIPLQVEGRAPGQEVGGIINQPAREIPVFCTPSTIPPSIGVDISLLEIGDRILLSQITFPEGVRASALTDETAVSCVGRRGGLLPEEAEGEEGEEGEEGAEGAEDADGDSGDAEASED